MSERWPNEVTGRTPRGGGTWPLEDETRVSRGSAAPADLSHCRKMMVNERPLGLLPNCPDESERMAWSRPAPTDPPPRSSTGRGRQGSRFARPCAAGERRGGRAREKPARCAACPRSEAEGVAGRQPGLGLLKSYLHRAHASPEWLTALRVERKPESNALSTTMWREARQRRS